MSQTREFSLDYQWIFQQKSIWAEIMELTYSKVQKQQQTPAIQQDVFSDRAFVQTLRGNKDCLKS